MKAHDYFSDARPDAIKRKNMKNYSYLVGKKVKAIPTSAEYEEEIFTVVGLKVRKYTTKIYAVLKSEENYAIVEVEAYIIGRERKDYYFKPNFILELLE